MNEPKRSIEELIKTFGGAVTVCIGVLTLITQLEGQIEKVLQITPDLGWVFYLTAGVLILVGIWLFWDGFARRSRLLQPEVLLLKPDKTEHLVGRSEDLDRLSRECSDHRQVHLVGESGAGKSALVRAGLCPQMKGHARLIPVCVDVWGEDWEIGPRTTLVNAVWDALSEGDRATLGLTTPTKPGKMRATLEQVAAKLGRLPLLIFDQFDDYQSRHQPRFLPHRRRTWLPAEKLIEENPFWRDIKELMDGGVIHCLFVTRTDAADGLESIRFLSPQVYRLDRVRVDFVEPLLTSLTTRAEGADPVVSAPTRGWDRLKKRLVRDLGRDGTVLPVQMKIVLQGLASLRALTTTEYERKGGLRGLEAAHIEGHVANTARHVGLTRPQVRAILVSLIDRETLKTIPKSTDELQRAVVPDGRRDPAHLRQDVEDALNYLEQREIVRKRLDPDTRRHVWILDHDYLCRGVLETEHKANRWLLLAQENHRAFLDAGAGLWRKWRSLLSPRHQIVLAWLRLTRRFRYGDLRSYGIWSLLRFIPYLLVVCGLVAAWTGVAAARDRREADRILSLYFADLANRDPSEGPSTEELDYLWELTTGRSGVRRSFLEQALGQGKSMVFNRRSELLVQAVVGLDRRQRRWVLQHAIRPRVESPPEDPDVRMACVRIGVALSWKEGDFLLFAATALAQAIREARVPTESQELAGTLEVVVGRMTPQDAAETFPSIRALADKLSDAGGSRDLARVLATAAQKLAPRDANEIGGSIIADMKKTRIAGRLLCLAGALKALAGAVPPKDTLEALHSIVETVEKDEAAPSQEVDSLVDALISIAGELPPENASEVSRAIVTSMTALVAKLRPGSDEATSLSNPAAMRLRYLANALKAVQKEPPSTEVRAVLMSIATAVKTSTDPILLLHLSGALEAMPGVEDVQEACESIISRMRNAGDPVKFAFLADALKAISPRLTDEGAWRTLQKVMADMNKISDRTQLNHLARGLAVVVERLGPMEDAQVAYTFVIGRMESTDDPVCVGYLADALELILGKLPPKNAEEACGRIVQTMEKMEDASTLRSLAKALKAARWERQPQVTQRAFDVVARSMMNTSNVIDHSLLASAFRAIPGDLAPKDGREVLEDVLADVANPDSDKELSSQGEALFAVAEKLAPEDTLDALGSIMNAMRKPTGTLHRPYLARGLAAAAGKLDRRDAAKAFQSIRDAMNETRDANQLDCLAKALQQVPGKLDAQELIDLLKWPTSVGPVRAARLARLEQETGKKFDGDLWCTVTWAEKNGFDVTTRPRRPARQQFLDTDGRVEPESHGGILPAP